MKLLTTLALAAALASGAAAQTVHPAGAATVAVSWQAATNPDSVRLDLDGDQVADVLVASRDQVGTRPAPTQRFFWLAPLQAGVQLAADSVEFDSAHRFQAGETIARGLRWTAPGSQFPTLHLAYFLIGNGGTGGRGFFRDTQPGYVVVRKPTAAGGWRYWWIRLQAGHSNSTYREVYFYGSSVAAPLALAQASPASHLAYPNPTTDRWQLPATAANAPYLILDDTGRVLLRGVSGAEARVEAGQLPAGCYWLDYTARGRHVRQRVRKE